MALHVEVRLDEAADAELLDEEIIQLRRELLELDVDRVVRPTAGAGPSGTRAVEGSALGALLVEAGPGVIGGVVQAIMAWVSRRSTRCVKLTLGQDSIELSNVSTDDQGRMLEAFLARHTPQGPPL